MPKSFWGLVLVVEMIVIGLHLPSVWAPHFEEDEVIFTFLAERLARTPFQYNLRGSLEGDSAKRFVADTWLRRVAALPPSEKRANLTRRLEDLQSAAVLYVPLSNSRVYAFDPEVYDRSMFFHPPLYPYALTLSRLAMGSAGGPLLSIAAHATTVVVVGLLGCRWGGPIVGAIAAALAAVDPVLWLCGSRLWIDGMLAMMVTTAALTASSAFQLPRPRTSLAAGLAFGLACLTKLPALLIAPALALELARSRASAREKSRQILWYLAAAGALLGPWLILTRIFYGQWIPEAHPTEWLVRNFRYVRWAVSRPWYFYGSGLLLTAPVYAFAVRAVVTRPLRSWVAAPAVWAGAVIVALTIMGTRGLGFQLRYLAPAAPALCLLAAAGIEQSRPCGRVIAVVLGAVTFLSGFGNSRRPLAASPLPVVASWCLAWFGFDLDSLGIPLW